MSSNDKSMKHAVLEVRDGTYNLTLHPTPEQAVAHATALAKETDAHTDEEIAEYLQRGSITEGEWEVHLLTATLGADGIGADGTEKPQPFFVCEKKDEHHAWGIYSRRKSDPPTKPFRLVAVILDYENTVKYAEFLAEQFPEKLYSVQGASWAGLLPEAYDA